MPRNGIIGTGRRHGSLTLAGKVRNMTPQIAKQSKRRKPRGRAGKRRQCMEILYHIIIIFIFLLL